MSVLPYVFLLTPDYLKVGTCCNFCAFTTGLSSAWDLYCILDNQTSFLLYKLIIIIIIHHGPVTCSVFMLHLFLGLPTSHVPVGFYWCSSFGSHSPSIPLRWFYQLWRNLAVLSLREKCSTRVESDHFLFCESLFNLWYFEEISFQLLEFCIDLLLWVSSFAAIQKCWNCCDLIKFHLGVNSWLSFNRSSCSAI